MPALAAYSGISFAQAQTLMPTSDQAAGLPSWVNVPAHHASTRAGTLLPRSAGRIVAGANGGLVVTDGNGQAVLTLPESAHAGTDAGATGRNAFHPLTADLLTWLEQEETPQNGAVYFGYGLAMDGDTAFVGFDAGGAVDVYDYENGVWTLVQQIADPQPGDQFGYATAIDGNEAIIGANTATVNGNTWQGAAYIYTESNGTWSQSAMLTASDGAANAFFGQAVAIQGGVATVGAPSATVGGNANAGEAYVFTESGGTWSQQAALTASDGGASDYFGFSVGVSSADMVIVDSPYTAGGGQPYAGEVYIFTNPGGTWTQTQEFTAADADYGFGYSFAVDGDTALFGMENGSGPNCSYQGAAYIFTDSNGTWSQTQKLNADNGACGDGFGMADALSGSTAVIGAWGVNSYQGAAYIFNNSGGTWTQTQELFASDGQPGDYMGYIPFATSNGVALVSGFGHNSYVGATYFFNPSDLGLAVSAPQTVGQGQTYVSQTIATNNATAASPAVSATVTVPAAASFVSASATQGSCSEASGVVTCDFGAISGNAGTATANVTLKATGSSGTTIENTASVAKATP
ncbi:MAG: hypothetical protein ACRES7_09160, partial [Gammaproteobacteria bacterium]